MPGEGGAPPAAGGNRVRAGGFALELRQDLQAGALDHVRVETRRRERQSQQRESLVPVLDQGAHRTVQVLARRAEAERYGVLLEPLVERLGIEVARAFVEQVRRHVGDAGLVGRVLVGAAAEGELDRDQRQRGLVHQPGLDAARADDALDLGGAGSGCEQADERGERRHGAQAAAAGRRKAGGDHERLSSGRPCSLMR